MKSIKKIPVSKLLFFWFGIFIFFFFFISLFIQAISIEKLFIFTQENYNIDSFLFFMVQKFFNNERIFKFFENNISKIYFFVEMPLIFSFIPTTSCILGVLFSRRLKRDFLLSLCFRLLLVSLFPLPLLIIRSFEIHDVNILSFCVILEFLTILFLDRFYKRKVLKSMKNYQKILYSCSFYTKIGIIIFFTKFIIDTLTKGFLWEFFLTALLAELNCFICLLIMNKTHHFYKRHPSLLENKLGNEKKQKDKDVVIMKKSSMNKILKGTCWIFFIIMSLHIIFSPIFSKVSSPLTYTSFYASYYGWEKILKFLIKNDANVNARENGYTLLQVAMSRGHEQIITLLIKNGASLNVEDNLLGWTPLHHATQDNHKKIVTLLIKSGANINAKGKKYGFTPLHIAVFNDYTETISLLIKNKADVSIKDNENRSPLDIAKIRKRNDIIKILIHPDF